MQYLLFLSSLSASFCVYSRLHHLNTMINCISDNMNSLNQLFLFDLCDILFGHESGFSRGKMLYMPEYQ